MSAHNSTNRQRLPDLLWIPFFVITVAFSGCDKARFAGQGQTGNVASNASAERPDFTFTHTIPPLISEDDPNLKVGLPFFNRTDSAVHFQEIRTSCACSAATLDKMVLKPDEQGVLTVSLNLRTRTGPQIFNVFLDDASGQTWHHQIETTVYDRAWFNVPHGVLQLGCQDPDATGHRDVTLESSARSEADLPKIIDIKPGSPIVTVTLGKARTQKVANAIWTRKLPVRISYTVPKTPGPYQVPLTATWAHRGARSAMSLQVSGYTNSLYEVHPSIVYFNQADGPAKSAGQRIVIRRTDGGPVNIQGLELTDEAVTAELQPSKDVCSAVLSLKLKNPEVTRPVWGEMTVWLDHPRQRMAKIQFVATPEKVD